jgi:hypothetical protein
MSSDASKINSDSPGGTSTLPGPEARNGFLSEHVSLLVESYRHWTGRALIGHAADPVDRARLLYHEPRVVASHGTEADPIFNYGNCMALALWETTWQVFTAMPSRLSAEPMAQEERRAFLARVNARGFIDDYSGIRVSTQGRRLRIKRATVWNVVDARGDYRGQAVVFREWEYL